MSGVLVGDGQLEDAGANSLVLLERREEEDERRGGGETGDQHL